MGAMLVELWTELLYVLKVDVNSDNQLTFPSSKIGFLKKLRIVLIILSASDGRLSIDLE